MAFNVTVVPKLQAGEPGGLSRRCLGGFYLVPQHRTQEAHVRLASVCIVIVTSIANLKAAVQWQYFISSRGLK